MVRGKRILIVDDDRKNRMLLDAMLKSLGHETCEAASGSEALTMLRENPTIDLVLLDIMMPGLDGFEVARRIRQDETHGDVPIIMVTGLTSKGDRLNAVAAGANDFIAKPVDKLELTVRIGSLLKMKEAQDKLKQQRAELEATCRVQDAALQELLETSAKIVRGIPCGLFVYQYQEPNELFLVNTNPEAERLTGITTEAWRGQELDEVWPNARSQGLYHACLQVMRTGEQINLDAIHFKRDDINRFFRVRAFPMPGQLLGLAIEDLTDLVKAEESLRQQALSQPAQKNDSGVDTARIVPTEKPPSKEKKPVNFTETVISAAHTYAKLCHVIVQSAETAIAQVGSDDTAQLTAALGRIITAGKRGGQLAQYLYKMSCEQRDEGDDRT